MPQRYDYRKEYRNRIMTEREAYRVLGIPPGGPKDQIKKRYRKLMLQLHPDALAASGEFDLSLAQKITLAYSVLKKSMEAENPDASRPAKGPAAQKGRPAWDAPLNPYAYREREILHYAEAFDGSVLGSFCVARGKYLWKTEEDFPLFLQSVYRCGKELLDEIDAALGRKKAPAIRQTLQAELTYLLAQQFIDGPAVSRAGNPAGACQRLRLWMRFSPENRVRMPENLNLRIEALLKRYR